MWPSRIVYYRDFAYNRPRLRMATGSIGDVPAATFAEYVDDPFLDVSSSAPTSSTDASESSAAEHEEELRDAPPPESSQLGLAQRPQSASRCLALRPGLAHRLYSHRLHVRAKAKLQRDRLLSGPMINVYVGAARRHWALHRNLLCHHSELLEGELEGDGHATPRKETLELPDHDPAGFELLVKWLYQGRLDDVSDLADASQQYEHAVSCHELHRLCDRLDMPQLRNVAMDQYRKGLHEAQLVPDADEIDDIYRRSPHGSPFRTLMTRVAARQIMDPASERDVKTYRACFANNPDFAVDLVNAIRHGTGGLLFDDPTALGNPCEYHDHHDGPSCHVKGKGRVKHGARKTPAAHRDPTSANSTPSTSSAPQSLPPRPPPPKTPRQPPRRRLTSPAISTVGTSPETATASPPPNLDASRDREKWRRVTPPERKKPSPEHSQTAPETTTQSHPAPGEPLPSSGDTSRPPTERARATIDEEHVAEQEEAAHALQKTPTRRGIWEWARAGTGRLNIVGRIGHVPINGSTRGAATLDAHDDFGIPSTTATEPSNEDRQRELAAANMQGLGIANAHAMSPHFAQTKQSSDELVSTASSSGSPESRTNGGVHWTTGQGSTPAAAPKDSPPSTPDTPTPQQRGKNTTAQTNGVRGVQQSPTPQRISRSSTEEGAASPADGSDISSDAGATGTPNNWNKSPTATPKSNMSAKTKKASKPRTASNHVPKYKIALAPNVLSSLNSTAAT